MIKKLTDSEGEYQLSTSNVKLHPDNDGSVEEYGIQLPRSHIELAINEQSQKLIELEDNQIKFLLLTQCFNTKIYHLLRTVPPSLTIPHLLPPFNRILRNIVTSIMDVQDMTENQWHQCTLKLSQSG